ncbi:5113_t:CDS:2 [Dentiscutata erythropus]|uniref:4-nitrophenylphosphatase n=1 Tax=Dentiscutata erythropus TaxID=1348616 RepID=A0A9N8ZBU4_9GLOM|nr:5113_t:CDS:2 [Dentiscutata erythropus]
MSKGPIKLCNIKDYDKFIDKFDTFLLDCDGVLWRGDHVIPGVQKALSYMRKIGKKILFVTNASKSRTGCLEKFKKLNIEAYEDNNTQDPTFDLENIAPDPEIGAVICANDKNFNYQKLSKALCYLSRNPDCIFIATTLEANSQGNCDYPVPASGTIAVSILMALGRKPDIIIGKPNKPMMDCIIQNLQLFDAKRICMIGDRLDTDVQFGINNGFTTLLTLTGITTENDLLVNNISVQSKSRKFRKLFAALQSNLIKSIPNPSPTSIIPDYYISSFGEFSKLDSQ